MNLLKRKKKPLPDTDEVFALSCESRCFICKEDGDHDEQADYFIKLPMNWKKEESSVEEIKKAFDGALVAGKGFAPKYDTLSRLWTDSDFQKDDFCSTVYISDRSSPWHAAYDRLRDATTEQEALTVLSSIALINRPEFWNKYKALYQKRDELDPNRLFGDGFLDTAARYDEARGAEPLYLAILRN